MTRNSMIKICLVFLFFQSALAFKDCKVAINYYVASFNPLNATNPLVSTGIGVNDLGKYDTCIRGDEDGKLNNTGINGFAVIRARPIDGNITAYPESFVGLCLPRECMNAQDLATASRLYTNMTFGVYAANELILSTELNEVHKQSSGGLVVVVVLMIMYVLCGTGLVNLAAVRLFKIERSQKVAQVESQEASPLNYQTSEKSEFVQSASTSNASQNKEEYSNLFLHMFDITANVSFNFSMDLGLPRFPAKQLRVFDGLKTISLGVLAYSYSIAFLEDLPVKNPQQVKESSESFFWNILFNGSMAAEVFFVVSGFLCSFWAMKRLETVGDLALSILGRAIRLWPAFVFVFLFYWKIFPYMLDGPLSGYIVNKYLDSCDSYWGFSMIFSNSLLNDSLCFNWGWAIENDLWFYALGVLLVLAYKKSTCVFYSLYGVSAIVSLTLEAVIISKYDLTQKPFDLWTNQNYKSYYYYRPYTRLCTYLIGVWFGVKYYEYVEHRQSLSESEPTGNCVNIVMDSYFEKLRSSTGVSCLVYFIGLLLILLSVFIVHGDLSSGFLFAYNLLSREFLALGIILLVSPLLVGRLHPLGGWLSESFFTNCSKVSLSVVLITPLVIQYIYFNLRTTYYYTTFYLFLWGTSFMVLAFVLAFVYSAVFEVPFIKLKRRILAK